MKKMTKTRWTVLISIALIFILSSVTIIFIYSMSPNVVMKVNDRPVWEKEFEVFMKQNRLKLKSSIAEKGENATEERMKEEARQQIIPVKIEEQLAEKYELGSYDFYQLKQQMIDRNQENQKKLENSEQVYGLKSYTLEQYISYVHSNMEIQLKGVLTKNEFNITEKQIKSYYEEHIDLFAAVSTDEFLIISGENNETTQTNIKELMSLKPDLLVKQESYEGLSITHQKTDQDNYYDFAKTNEEIAVILRSLKAGEFSDTIEQGNRVILLYCISREDAGYESLDDSRQAIEMMLGDNLYNLYIKNKVQEAAVWEDAAYFGRS